MANPFNQAETMRLAMQTTLMMAEAQQVIAMRLMGMAGGWRVTPAENARMMNEKSSAMFAAGKAASLALIAGASPQGVALAALKPVRAKTRANAARLARRGPGAPT
jgi:hypothetical protein